jgi:hypothetical protein
MGTNKRSQNGRGARVALRAHSTCIHTYTALTRERNYAHAPCGIRTHDLSVQEVQEDLHSFIHHRRL